MIFRQMGDTGLECSVIGLGTGRLASISGGISRVAAGKLLGAAEEYGINLIDTANSYAQGECEKILGQAMLGKRNKFILTTKAGYRFSPMGGGLHWLKPLAKRVLKSFKGGKTLAGNVRSNVSRQDFSTSAIRDSVTASLQRLQTDYLDLFLLHSPTVDVLANAELFEMLRQLKKEGKIRHFGISSSEPTVLIGAVQIAGLSVIQTPVNPLVSSNGALLSQLKAANIGVVANQIFLSGKLLSDTTPENEALASLRKRLQSLSATRDVSINRLLIEYALAQPGIVSVLTGTTNLEHLRQNVTDALAAHAAITNGATHPLNLPA